MVRVSVRFPMGVYHAQSQSEFDVPEWPPHPVRLIGALIAAASATRREDPEADRAVIGRLCDAAPPRIVAARVGDAADDGRAPDGSEFLTPLRGASRWAPRNHELAELKKGVSPRDIGRGRAEVFKVGVAVGDATIAFEWPDVALDPAEMERLRALAQDITVLGTSRSPVLVDVDDRVAAAPRAWEAADGGAATGRAALVRTPVPATVAAFDRWHRHRSAPTTRGGAPARAPYVPPATVGRLVAYVHTADRAAPAPHDAGHWGEMIILAVDRERSDALPKAPATFALARTVRRALLATYGDGPGRNTAPPILHGRGEHPHLAVVPLHFVAAPSAGPGGRHADGHTLGVALVLPHERRCPDIEDQREALQHALIALCAGTADTPRVTVGVPGIGNVAFRAVPAGARLPRTLTEWTYRRPSVAWSTVTPIVHSRYLPRRSHEALFDQVAADCRDVGLPEPARIEVRRGPRFHGAPARVGRGALDAAAAGPLRGPHSHVDLWFDRPVAGPLLLGRARHFGVGLCLPVPPGSAGPRAAEVAGVAS